MGPNRNETRDLGLDSDEATAEENHGQHIQEF
jgi:hypothetical protein